MIQKGTRAKILSGEEAGKIGVAVGKVPGNDDAPVWNVALPGKGQVRVEEKDLEEVT